jgi:sodium/hydrogen exchanger 8
MEDKTENFQFVYFAAMLVMFGLIHRLSQTKRLLWFPEASLQMLVGLIIALLIFRFSGFRNSFSADLFFYILLPPIMFNSGLDVNIKYFFQNFVTIMVYANIGTLINTLVVGGLCYQFGSDGLSEGISRNEANTFGALISATDPVTTIAVFDSLRVEPHLYTIVVGVSILDDAVAVILFDMFSKYQSGEATARIVFEAIGHFLAKLFVSMLLGYLCGVLFAWYLKENPNLLKRVPLFLASVVTFVYCSYLVGEITELSGIITTMFAAIAIRKCYERWSPEYFAILKHGANGWSYVFESIVFFNIGLTLLRRRPRGTRDYQFIGWSLFACFVGRVVQIYPLAFLLNWYNSRPVQLYRTKHAPSVAEKAARLSVDEELALRHSSRTDTTELEAPVADAGSPPAVVPSDAPSVTAVSRSSSSVELPSAPPSQPPAPATTNGAGGVGEAASGTAALAAIASAAIAMLPTVNTSTGHFPISSSGGGGGAGGSHHAPHSASSSSSSSSSAVRYQSVPTRIDPAVCFVPPPVLMVPTQRELMRKRGVVLSWGYQHMILFAGLRGPIAYATARLISKNSEHRDMFIAATNFTVAVTTFVLGALTVPALHWFDIKYGDAVAEWERQQEEELEASERLIIAASDSSTDGDDDFDGRESFDGHVSPSLNGAGDDASQGAMDHRPAAAARCPTLTWESAKLSWLAFVRVWRWDMTTDEWLEVVRHYEHELITRHFIPPADGSDDDGSGDDQRAAVGGGGGGGDDDEDDIESVRSGASRDLRPVSVQSAAVSALDDGEETRRSLSAIGGSGILMVPTTAAATATPADAVAASSPPPVPPRPSRPSSTRTKATAAPTTLSAAAMKRLAGQASPPTKPSREGLLNKAALESYLQSKPSTAAAEEKAEPAAASSDAPVDSSDSVASNAAEAVAERPPSMVAPSDAPSEAASSSPQSTDDAATSPASPPSTTV